MEAYMHISLSPELEKIIQDKVNSGFYNNASEVIRDAIRHLHEHDTMPMKLKKAIGQGLEDIKTGRTVAYDMDSIRKKAKADAKANMPITPDVQP
jgi:antitoxin ParD1/3/4